MPEIGECYTIAEKLSSKKGLKIKKISISNRFMEHIMKTPLFPLKSLSGMEIEDVFAYGKSIWFSFINNKTRVILVSQLGMTGSWFFKDKGRGKENDHFIITGEDETLRYSDPRMFGKMRLYGYNIEDTDWKNKTLLNFKFGIDPLMVSLKKLEETISNGWKKNKDIKVLMLEQNIVFGIGNYLASEILFEAKIHPQVKGKDLTLSNFKDIAEAIKKISLLAKKSGGHSFAEGFFHPDGSTGTMDKYIEIYGKEGQLCPRRHTIEKIDQAGRSTFFCPFCQKK